MTQSSIRPATIESQNVDLIFSPDAGVFDLTYSVPEGSILGMIGPSGCGKTTTVRLALGLYTPQRGSLRVFDRDPTTFRASDREQIGYIPQQFVLYPSLTVAENATFVASLYGLRTSYIKQRLDELLPFVDLAEARDRLGSQLSGGMQRRLMLAERADARPDPAVRRRADRRDRPGAARPLLEYFRQLRDEGRTLFVTTQYVGEATYCDYVAVMRKGRLLAVDTPAGLRRRVLGGEIIHLHLEDPGRAAEAVELLRRYDPVQDVRRLQGTDNQLHVAVADAGEWLPEVLNMLENPDGPGIVVASAEEYQISYDDVFIKLMEQEEAAHG